MHVLQDAIVFGIASKCKCKVQGNANTKHKSKQVQKQMPAQIQIAKQGEDGSEVQDEEKRPRIPVVSFTPTMQSSSVSHWMMCPHMDCQQSRPSENAITTTIIIMTITTTIKPGAGLPPVLALLV